MGASEDVDTDDVELVGGPVPVELVGGTLLLLVGAREEVDTDEVNTGETDADEDDDEEDG